MEGEEGGVDVEVVEGGIEGGAGVEVDEEEEVVVVVASLLVLFFVLLVLLVLFLLRRTKGVVSTCA